MGKVQWQAGQQNGKEVKEQRGEEEEEKHRLVSRRLRELFKGWDGWKWERGESVSQQKEGQLKEDVEEKEGGTSRQVC